MSQQGFSAGPGPEMELLLACADPTRRSDAERLAASDLDWDVALRLASWHRVMPLLHRALEPVSAALPTSAWSRLHDAYLRNAAQNERWTQELVRVAGRLERDGVRFAVTRGPATAMALYGDLAMRQFSDLDLLIRPEDVERVTVALTELGYEGLFRLDARQQAALVRFKTERAFLRPAERLCVDLHWQMLPGSFAFERDEEGLLARCRRVEIGGAVLPVPDTNDLFVFLCVHGAKHAWDRLGFLTDVAEMIRIGKGLDWERVRLLAEKGGKRRALLLGLRLAGELLGAPVPAELAQGAAGDRAVTRLADEVRAGFPREVPPPRTLRRRWRFPIRALERARDRARWVVELALVPGGFECESVSLPRPLWRLYYPLRWGRMAVKYAAAAARRPRRSTRGTPPPERPD